jgi:hypothetical protein
MTEKAWLVKFSYDNGYLSKDQIKYYVAHGGLTTEEYKDVTGEDYVAEHLEAKAKEASDGKAKTEEGSSQPTE